MSLILLIDDCRDSASALVDLLERCGHEVIISQTIPTAFLTVEEQAPSLILANVMLKDVEGLDALHRFSSGLPQIVYYHAPDADWVSHIPFPPKGITLLSMDRLAEALDEMALDAGLPRPAERRMKDLADTDVR